MTLQNTRIREIPYNYTSFSDREIVIRLLGEQHWETLNTLREQRRTGRSARMLFEVLGDIWVIQRNPFIQDDLLDDKKRRHSLIESFRHRLDKIIQRADENALALQLLNAAQQAVDSLKQWLEDIRQSRHTVRRRLKKATRADNIRFDGFARVSHVTDATDWRVEYPFVVICPDTEAEVAAVVKACIQSGLTIIPRGGGTGYTGGVIPLHEKSAVINTEKLEKLDAPIEQTLPGTTEPVYTIRAEAGVITKRVAEKAGAIQRVFAVDPTSQDSSTIGGNIAMNAGGKKAVMWGTTIDNLYSWKMVTPNADWLEVERLDHNLGKIHDVPAAKFRVTRYKPDGKTPIGKPEILTVAAEEFRKPGLGKDVTNKFLGGLPGIQKEGCDGLITSSVFVLHKQPTHVRTICLEFFGANLQNAVPAIVEVKDHIDGLDEVFLLGMEHLDERYVRAVKYSTKAPRQELPKMLLFIGIGSEDEAAVSAAASKLVKLANARDAEGFIAVTKQAREQFWKDRKRTAAISAHTNAFKINEDVVIPLDKLAEYNDEIERINIELSTQNKLNTIDVVLAYLAGDMPELQQGACEESEKIVEDKRVAARTHLQNVRVVWSTLLNSLDLPASDIQTLCHGELLKHLRTKAYDATDTGGTIFSLMQKRALRISYRKAVSTVLNEVFAGDNFIKVREKLAQLHDTTRSSRLFVATHMHAGDGNVHTNIPVNSNDYEMMHEAEIVVARVMKIAERLNGVISGEHGIGITKMQFLPETVINAFADYKQRVDPKGWFNRGKLMPGSGLQNAYTPSLRLLEQEALILEASELGDLNNMVKNCLRCGKCKPVCNTHVPRANLLYSPRNKILAGGLLIEAFLYEEQTQRGISLRHFDEMNDVADHCTICHKCLEPCPVNIDYGDVTMKMRTILKKFNQRHASLGTAAAIHFLNVTDPTTIKLMRKTMIQFGFAAQRLGYQTFKRVGLLNTKKLPAATTGKMGVQAQVINFVKKPLPEKLPSKPMRTLLSIEEKNVVPILRDPSKVNEDSDAVFYFPGCGSERLFSQVGLATLAMLYEVGAETVLPPGYLCCGYPQNSTGDADKGKQITTGNRILFHRVANALNYMDIKTVIVSCGTCMDQLLKYQFEQIFPGCRLLDIHEYLLEKGIALAGVNGVRYMYHDPCHSPMKTYKPIEVASKLMAQPVLQSDRCCGEAGTFAVSRPDIATQVRFRKQEELHQGVQQLTDKPVAEQGNVKMLTACPACVQGLSRYRDEVGIETDYIVVELANKQLGDGWQQQFVQRANQGGIERVLL